MCIYATRVLVRMSISFKYGIDNSIDISRFTNDHHNMFDTNALNSGPGCGLVNKSASFDSNV
jgi:hypothetical protein